MVTKTRTELLSELDQRVSILVTERTEKLDRLGKLVGRIATRFPDGGTIPSSAEDDFISQLRAVLS